MLFRRLVCCVWMGCFFLPYAMAQSTFNPLTDPPEKGAKLVSPESDTKIPSWLHSVSFEDDGYFYSVGMSKWHSTDTDALEDANLRALWPVGLRISGINQTERIVKQSDDQRFSSETADPFVTEKSERRMFLQAMGVQLDQIQSTFAIHWRKRNKHYFRYFVLGRISKKNLKKLKKAQEEATKRAKTFMDESLHIRMIRYVKDESGSYRESGPLKQGEQLHSREAIRFLIDATGSSHVNYMLVLNYDERKLTNLFPGSSSRLRDGHYSLDKYAIDELGKQLFVANENTGSETFYFIFTDRRDPELERFLILNANNVRTRGEPAGYGTTLTYRGVDTRILLDPDAFSGSPIGEGVQERMGFFKTLSAKHYARTIELNHVTSNR